MRMRMVINPDACKSRVIQGVRRKKLILRQHWRTCASSSIVLFQLFVDSSIESSQNYRTPAVKLSSRKQIHVVQRDYQSGIASGTTAV